MRCSGSCGPTAGTATIDGKHYAELEQPFKTVGAVLEASGFHPGRSGRNHLRLLALASGIDESRVDLALDQVGLTDAAGKRVGAYSLGMRQRLALAGAMLGNPQVLVLDEPANGLDPEGIHWLRDLLRALAHEGRTVLVSSHVLAEMSQTVDEVVIINKGKLVAKAPVEELLKGGSQKVRVRGPQGEELASRIHAAGLTVDARRRRARRHGRDDRPGRRRGRRAHAARAERVRVEPGGDLPRADRREHAVVILLVRAEMLKLRTTRAAKVLALALAALVILVVLLVVFKAHAARPRLARRTSRTCSASGSSCRSSASCSGS